MGNCEWVRNDGEPIPSVLWSGLWADPTNADKVLVQVDSDPLRSFGFQLRTDANEEARQGMLDLLRDAFNSNATVVLDYEIEPPKKNGVVIRMVLEKP